MHYYRARRYGDPEHLEFAGSSMGLAERLWRRVDKSGECWIWTAGRDAGGYGNAWTGERVEKAHRVAWIVTHGLVPAGLFVCHHCDNPPCCRPDHLFLGTPKDNGADMASKGRSAMTQHPELQRGSRNNRAVLTEEQVIAIRAGCTGRRGEVVALGRQYGVSHATISLVLSGKNWGHLGRDGAQNVH